MVLYYWNYLGNDQFSLLKILKNSPSAVDDGILMISLCSEVGENAQKFIKAVSQFIRNADNSFALLLDTIQG